MISNLMGVPYSGSDICGYDGVISSELCTKWHFLGAFYPLSKNFYRNASSNPKEPSNFPSTYAEFMRDAILLKYKLIPYYHSELTIIS